MLDIGEFLAEIRAKFPRMSLAFERIENAVNAIANAVGVDPSGSVAPPPAPQSIQVAAGTDHVHVTITDNSARTRARNYFLEWSVNDPSFGNPQPEFLGPVRQKILSLPAKDNSNNAINYQFRVYSMEIGSKSASEKTYFGTALNPTSVALSGTSKLTPLPSTGSGTAATNGQQGGQGFGASPIVRPSTPKEIAE